MTEVDILGVRVDAQTLDDAVERIADWIARGDAAYVCVTGVHGVVECQDDPSLRRIHNDAGMVTADGMPLVWLGRRRVADGTAVERVYGPDLMDAAFTRSERAGWRHFFLGTTDETLARLRRRMAQRHPGAMVVGALSPPFRDLTPDEDAAITAAVVAARPDIVWVGMSTPRQERWMAAHVGRIPGAVLVGVGAAFDFHAGTKPQAPPWMQRLGLEWLFRLAHEPGRLKRRYLRNNPRFAWLVLRQERRERATRAASPGAGPGTAIRRAVASSSAARVAAVPSRVATVARHDAGVVASSVRWLAQSHEHTNFTYDLTELNRQHLAWFTSVVCEVDIDRVRTYFEELELDERLRAHIAGETHRSARRGLADPVARFGRRLGWYAMVRARAPRLVVETGTDKGLGTCVLAAALLRNADEGRDGQVVSIDINRAAGYLAASEPWSRVVDLRIGDSLEVIREMDGPVDLFLHDSDHSARHEAAELAAIEPHTCDRSLLLTDNASVTNVLAEHAERTARRFLAFRETPAAHWYPGEVVGAAW